MKYYWLLFLFLFHGILNAQKDSALLFKTIYENSFDKTGIDRLLHIPDSCTSNIVEIRTYTQVSKSDNPKYFFECTIVRRDNSGWHAGFYGIALLSSNRIYHYNRPLKVVASADSIYAQLQKKGLFTLQDQAASGEFLFGAQGLVSFCDKGKKGMFLHEHLGVYRNETRRLNKKKDPKIEEYYKIRELIDSMTTTF